MRMMIAIAAALAAAITFAMSAVLQQESARELPDADALRPRMVLRLARRPLWLAGIATMDLAYIFQVLALAFGPVAVVEPVVASELIFAVPIAVHHAGRRPGSREWIGMLACAGGVSAFLVAAHPNGGGTAPDAWRWLLGFGPWAVAFCALVFAGRCDADGTRRAAFLGAAAGTSFGVLSLVTKSGVTILTNQGLLALLTSWQPWVLLAVGAVGFFVGQSAYQAAPLASSLPIMDAVEPISAVVLSAYVLQENIALTPGALTVEAAGGLATITGIFLLGRSPLVLAIYASSERDKQRSASGDPDPMLAAAAESGDDLTTAPQPPASRRASH